jgi:hypothetical protein
LIKDKTIGTVVIPVLYTVNVNKKPRILRRRKNRGFVGPPEMNWWFGQSELNLEFRLAIAGKTRLNKRLLVLVTDYHLVSRAENTSVRIGQNMDIGMKREPGFAIGKCLLFLIF